MKLSVMFLTAVAMVFSVCQTAAGQAYTPPRPIAKPIVLPKPVANRLIKRERQGEKNQAVPADN